MCDEDDDYYQQQKEYRDRLNYDRERAVSRGSGGAINSFEEWRKMPEKYRTTRKRVY